MTETTERDVVDILTDDHHSVLDLIGSIASIADLEQQRNAADTVIAELVRHSAAEEMYVYPAIREHVTDGEEQVRHDIEEHQELEETLKRLEGAHPDDSQFAELVAEVERQLRHHAADEENNQFPELRASLRP